MTPLSTNNKIMNHILMFTALQKASPPAVSLLLHARQSLLPHTPGPWPVLLILHLVSFTGYHKFIQPIQTSQIFAFSSTHCCSFHAKGNRKVGFSSLSLRKVTWNHPLVYEYVQPLSKIISYCSQIVHPFFLFLWVSRLNKFVVTCKRD